jgi:hypothetical protein
MIRALTLFSVAALLVAAVSLPFMVLQPGPVVIGGHYHIGSGEALSGNMSFYFAQVTIDEGALVNGHISLYSSTLDLRGTVTKGIQAFESDLKLRDSGLVDGKIEQSGLLHWTVLLPAILSLP